MAAINNSHLSSSLDDFLEPLRINLDKIQALSQSFLETFEHLSEESPNQFLPTPISESILRPVSQSARGW